MSEICRVDESTQEEEGQPFDIYAPSTSTPRRPDDASVELREDNDLPQSKEPQLNEPQSKETQSKSTDPQLNQPQIGLSKNTAFTRASTAQKNKKRKRLTERESDNEIVEEIANVDK